MQTLLLLGGNKDSRLIGEIAKEMGLHIIVADRNGNCEARSIANVFVEASCYHRDQILAAVHGFEIHAVLCAGVDAPHVMAAIAQWFDIIGPSKWTANHSMDKINQRKLFQNYNLNKPIWNQIHIPQWRIENPFIEDWLDGIMIVKPADSRGARGVMRLSPGDSWQEARDESAKSSPTGRTLFERWINGAQLSSESLIQDGKVLWTAYSERNYDKIDKYKPYVIEDGGDMPPDISLVYENDYTQKAHEQLQMCVDVLEFETGTLKGDLVWGGKDIHVIEVATRLSGGGYCEPQIRLCWGVPFVELAIKLALGKKIKRPKPYLKNRVCQRYQFSGNITKHPERGDWVVATGKSRKKARERAKEMLE